MKRCKPIAPFLVSLMSSLVLSTCSAGTQQTASQIAPTGSAPTATITVSAAASLQDALAAIAPQFRAAHPNISIDYNFGASGALQQQIQQGAPADVFFSAASKQMDTLAESGAIAPDSRQTIVTNQLVLIAPAASTLQIDNLAQLKTIEIDRFAVGEFRSVPAGQYAQQVFKQLDLLAPLEAKFVFGNNVRGVLAAVASGNADLGMVYATDAALSDRVKIAATAPANAHDPIVYPVAIVQTSPRQDTAQIFIDFLTTETAQTTFTNFGFSPP